MKKKNIDYTSYCEETINYNKLERQECIATIEHVYQTTKDNEKQFNAIFRHKKNKPFSLPIFDSLEDIPNSRYIPIVLRSGELNQEIYDANFYDFRCHSACFILNEIQDFISRPISDQEKLKLINKRRNALLLESVFVYGMISFACFMALRLVINLVLRLFIAINV